MSDPYIELRGEIAREHMDVLDAVVQATPGASRMALVRQIIGEWVGRKTHEASLIARVRRGNGIEPETDRHAAESGRKRGGNL